MKTNRYQYIGTPLHLTEQETYHLTKYLKRGKRQGTIIQWENFDLDLPALNTPIQLACSDCHLAHRHSCCEGGFPFPPTSDLLPTLDTHLPSILEQLPEDTAAHIRQHGLCTTTHPETEGHPTIGTHPLTGNCLFCQTGPTTNGPSCTAHRHALQTGLPPHTLKPLSCHLYPLDLILDHQTGRTLLTSLTPHTSPFTRWGPHYLTDYLCSNPTLRHTLASGDGHHEGNDDVNRDSNIHPNLPPTTFPLTSYQPAYLEQKTLLTTLYPPSLWDTIHHHLTT